MTFDIMLPYYGDVSLMQAAVRSVTNSIGAPRLAWPYRVLCRSANRRPTVSMKFSSCGSSALRPVRSGRRSVVVGHSLPPPD